MNIFNSIEINQKQLEELNKQCLHYNIFPMDLTFYLFTKEINNHPVSKLSKNLLNDILEQIDLMSNDEYEDFINSFPSIYKFLIDHDKLRGKLDKERVALNCLIAKLWEIKLCFKKVIESEFQGSEVYKIYPELSYQFDENNLLKINDSFVLHDGGIEYKNHILHYSQFLRRGFGGNPNFNFFYNFIKYYHLTKNINEFRIAIDFNRIMPKEFYHQRFEFDTWYGVPFDINKIDNPNDIGVTVLIRNQNSLFKLDNNLEKTEFFWTYKNNIKTLQIEEINGLEGKIQNYYINRYIHSERSINKKKFIHLDGAVKITTFVVPERENFCIFK